MAGLYEGGDPRFLDAKRAKLIIDEAERISFNRGLIVGALATIALLLLAVGWAQAAEVSSVRDSDHEWYCETDAGVEISGHTRQDKAFQSCMNKALQDGATYIVRGGTYRVTASGTVSPPTDPPPPIDPPPEPPADDLPQVTFGPVSAITQYPNSISALAQDNFRWQLTFTLNTVTGIHGLASRDESGTTQAGHLSVWVENGLLNVRHQDGGPGVDGIQTLLTSTTVLQANTEYEVIVSVEKGVGIGMWIEGLLEISSPDAYGLSGNDLPLTLGGLCTRCDDTDVPPTGPDRPADGTVSMAIYADPLPMPNGSVMLNWTNPTEDVDGQALPAGIPSRITIYRAGVERLLVSHLDGESTAYEVTGLGLGDHCFTATAWNLSVESEDSNTICKPVP